MSGDKIGDCEDDDAWEHLGDDEGNAGIDGKSSTALGVFPVRSRLEDLAQEGHDCEHETEDHQAEVDPETDVVVSNVCDGAGISHWVVGKEEVGYTVKDTDPSITG